MPPCGATRCVLLGEADATASATTLTTSRYVAVAILMYMLVYSVLGEVRLVYRRTTSIDMSVKIVQRQDEIYQTFIPTTLDAKMVSSMRYGKLTFAPQQLRD